jgi:hypothetical protein
MLGSGDRYVAWTGTDPVAVTFVLMPMEGGRDRDAPYSLDSANVIGWIQRCSRCDLIMNSQDWCCPAQPESLGLRAEKSPSFPRHMRQPKAEDREEGDLRVAARRGGRGGEVSMMR